MFVSSANPLKNKPFSMRIGSILLAAGGSTRLGSPKQLLTYRGRSLLHRAAEAVLATGCHPVVAVVGARADEMRAALAGQAVAIIENVQWERGMGSSLRLGLEALLTLASQNELDGVLLALCDQPLVEKTQLERLLRAFAQTNETPHPLVAASYDGTHGVPAIFGRCYFRELVALHDAAGAKQVLTAHRHELTEVPLPEASIDIDTREQYEKLIISQPGDDGFSRNG